MKLIIIRPRHIQGQKVPPQSNFQNLFEKLQASSELVAFFHGKLTNIQGHIAKEDYFDVTFR